VGAGRGPGRRSRVGGGHVRRAVAAPRASRARIRGRDDLRGRHLARRRYRARPVRAATAASRRHRRAVILSVPWWAHRRRRAKVRLERKLQAWPDIARAIGLAGAEVMSATVDVWGWRARFRLARGQIIRDVTARIPAIESGLGTFRGAVRVYPTPDDLAHRCEIRMLEMDPHAGAIPWPGPSVTSVTQPVDLGPFEDASPCQVVFARLHGILGGTTGSGKSGGLNVLMGNLVACRDVVIWAVDLKKGMELGPWESCIDRLTTTAEQAIALLRDAVAVLEARAALLAAAGKRGWPISPGMPALIILIDEYAELADEAPGAMSDTDSIARLGRAVAVTLIAATQRPTQKAMGAGAVRSQMDLRICFRVREPRDVDLVLGQGMLRAGWDAHNLNAPGKFLISAPGHDTPRRARAYLLTDQVAAGTAAHYVGSRPGLDAESRRAIGSARWPGTLACPDHRRAVSDTLPQDCHFAFASEGFVLAVAGDVGICPGGKRLDEDAVQHRADGGALAVGAPRFPRIADPL